MSQPPLASGGQPPREMAVHGQCGNARFPPTGAGAARRAAERGRLAAGAFTGSTTPWYRVYIMSFRAVWFATSLLGLLGLLGAAQLIVSCSSSSSSKSDAASGGAGGGGGTTGSGGAGGPLDAAADGTESACPIDGEVVADPLAGVWRGVQGTTTYTLTNSGGCSTWVGVQNGTACAFCGGTYAVTGPTSGTSTVSCGAGCGGAAHTDTGTLTLSGCSLTYSYNFGSGSSSWIGSRIADATGDICAQADAGTL